MAAIEQQMVKVTAADGMQVSEHSERDISVALAKFT